MGASTLITACTASFSNLSHAHAENAIDTNDDFIARFNEVDHTEFHPGTAGAADWKSHGIAGPEDCAKHLLDFLHHLNEGGIQVTQQGHGTWP